MNASNQATTYEVAAALASVGTLVKNYFPDGSINFSPWREDPYTSFWHEEDTLDLSLHFPGWSPSYECRSLLIQLRVIKDCPEKLPRLLGVMMRGVTFDGERWRLVTVGDWHFTGPYLPKPAVKEKLNSMCRDFFTLFPSD